jgi:hypothetical protein
VTRIFLLTYLLTYLLTFFLSFAQPGKGDAFLGIAFCCR